MRHSFHSVKLVSWFQYRFQHAAPDKGVQLTTAYAPASGNSWRSSFGVASPSPPRWSPGSHGEGSISPWVFHDFEAKPTMRKTLIVATKFARLGRN